MPYSPAVAMPSRAEAVESAGRWKTRAQNVAKRAKEGAENVLGVGVAVGAAAAVGYWIGRDPENTEWMGVDKEIWIGGILAVLGITGMGGRTMSGFARNAGAGILSAWAYNKAFARAEEGGDEGD